MSTHPYLFPKALAALALEDAERIRYIQEGQWIGYPRARLILGKMEELLAHPRVDRMQHLLIVADSNNGKSRLLTHFAKQHPPSEREDGQAVHIPVLMVEAPPQPDEGRFYNQILERLFVPYRPSDRVDKKQVMVMRLLREVGLKMLMVDEVHHLLAGSMHRQRAFLNALKHLGNQLQVNIVAAGIRDAFHAIQTDPQLANRFHIEQLPLWKSDDEDYERLLSSFEAIIPLRNPSGLANNTKLCQQLHMMSEGLIGELWSIIKLAAVAAIKDGSERITIETLNNLNWISPSRRKRQMDHGR
ncbi:MAG: TniB family NTP-binding protein [Gammaproteobacteria bacterium]|nr:TniB family NTP-binding protein [Gammaproteobacteria bacterium]